jgi:hypothetical protein
MGSTSVYNLYKGFIFPLVIFFGLNISFCLVPDPPGLTIKQEKGRKRKTEEG